MGLTAWGYKITSEALVFGGQTVTATDIAVKLGMAELGDPSLVSGIDDAFAAKAMAAIREMVEECLDALKLSTTMWT